MNDITDENGRVSQDYLIEKLKNKINFFSEFSRLKKAIPKEWYVQLSEEKSVKTTINIKKENIMVIDMDKLVNKDFLQYYQKQSFYQTYRYTFLDNLLGYPRFSKYNRLI